ncbi:MAG: ABC transporter ATP-binding protein, partial [Candidatus Competibacterales bacterium]|nr:ABC transporter ATP-binding protein [Candidatus Competibacterales bacterium]
STLRMIAGFEAVSQGTIHSGERRIDNLAPAKRNVAMAFEGYALYPPLRIRDNIGFSMLRDHRPRAEVQRKVREIAELLAIEDILERYPPTISGGQQQRTSLARALVRKAELYLLDEPMSQLEPQLRVLLRARIKDYLIQHHMTTVFVTHDQTEAMALADRIAVMEGGELQQFGSPEDLRERPANLFVASFIGEPPMNLLAARVATDGGPGIEALDGAQRPLFRIALDAGALPPGADSVLTDGRRIHLGIRPHRIRFAAPQQAGETRFHGRVTSNQWLGDQTHVGLELGDQLLIGVSDGDIDAPLDATVEFGLPLDALHLFDADDGRALLHGLQPREG